MLRYFSPVAGFTFACCTILAIWAAMGWPGRPIHFHGDVTYCEALHPGPVRQPANTWSTFGFVAAGLGLAWRARSRRAALLAALIAFLGPGAAAMHASMLYWCGVIDAYSMLIFISFFLAHDAEKLWPRLRFGPMFWAMAAATAALAALELFDTVLIFASQIALMVVFECLIGLRGVGRGRDRRWLWGTILSFSAASWFWALSVHGESALCRPDSILQGHAAWHLLSAVAAAFLYMYLEPEFPAAA